LLANKNFFSLLLLGIAITCTLKLEPLRAANLVEAYSGQPYGVGRVTVGVLRGQPALLLSDERFTLLEANGRAIYPVLKEESAKRLVRELLQIETPRQVTIYFLFKGDTPFDLSVYAPHEQGVRVKPREDQAAHRRLLKEWWEQVTQRLHRLQNDPAYPPVAENFFTATLARRLQLDIPEPKAGLLSINKPKDSVLDELFLTEAYQLQSDRLQLQHYGQLGPDVSPLPDPIAWKNTDISDKELDEVPVESIATHVPEECFYLRFGNFTNYLWCRDFNKKWQGDIVNMVLRRGILRGASARTQQQLSLRENALAKILGPQVIADAAIIGHDPYVAQGAGIGILFQAKNSFLLNQDLMKQRREALTKFADAKEETIKLLDHEVSLIATPDGRVRSLYVQRDDFHLVTTSFTLATRFLQAAGGDRTLSDLPSFRQARQQFPLKRDDTLFAFLSPKFFQNLCSPQYRIESMRRLRSFRERHLLELARYAARVEGIEAVGMHDLIEANMLPVGFDMRPDQSQLLESEAGYLDTVRGAPGYFLPVADVPVLFASSAELADFKYFAEQFQKEIGQLPPIAISVKRIPHQEKSDETMRIDLWASQLANTKIGSLTENLGEPSAQSLSPIDGDILAVEAVLNIPVPLVGGESQAHHLFGALRDFRTPWVAQGGAVRSAAAPTELVRGYLGAWPRPGVLEMFLGSAKPNGNKPQRAGDHLWQAQKQDFLLISFKPEVIEEVLPHLALEPAPRPAQLRVRLSDLTGTQMAHNVNALGYSRSRETCVAASRMMNSLANQLQVPRPECREVAERLVDGKFVCALGGKYQLFAPDRGLEVWLSSSLPESNRFLLAEVPEDYQLPLLTWFRGLRGDLQVTDQTLHAHLEIDMTAAALP
jgi:hypothetical protein